MENKIDLFTSLSGEKISNPEDWEKFRRPELMFLLETFEYGKRPFDKVDSIEFRERLREKNFRTRDFEYREATITVNGFTFPIYIFLPSDTTKPVPAFLFIVNEARCAGMNFRIKETEYSSISVSEITARGYAVIMMFTRDVAPDWHHYSEFREGIFKAMEPDVSKRNSTSWGVLSGWAFGASCVMDYIETMDEIATDKVAVVGHSRDGKTALWAAATDTRFAMSISCCSGCGGAAYTRGKKGEHFKNLSCTDWFCDNCSKYYDREEMMPFDQHMLLAAIAPRPLYVKSAAEDVGADPEAELYGAKLAAEVYELYGLPGIVVDEEIELDKEYIDGTVAYHCATGGHDITTYDWQCFMDFADKYFK